MPIKLGWKVQLEVAVRADPAPQETTITIGASPGWDPMLEAFRRGMKDLATAVDHGAMCGALIKPSASSMKILDVEITKTGELQARVEVAGIDPGAWRTITSLVVFFTYGSRAPRVRISSVPSSRSPRGARPELVTERTVWDLPYPRLPAVLPFRLERDDEHPADDVVLRVRFRTKVPARRKLPILLAFKTWASLLVGGYPHDDEDMTTCSTSSFEADFVDPRTLEYVADYRGHLAGLDAAVMMAWWFHEHGTLVESVTIE